MSEAIMGAAYPNSSSLQAHNRVAAQKPRLSTREQVSYSNFTVHVNCFDDCLQTRVHV
jgi:hypothetical protein